MSSAKILTILTPVFRPMHFRLLISLKQIISLLMIWAQGLLNLLVTLLIYRKLWSLEQNRSGTKVDLSGSKRNTSLANSLQRGPLLDQILVKHGRKKPPEDWRKKSHGRQDLDGSKGRCQDYQQTNIGSQLPEYSFNLHPAVNFQ